MTVGQRIDILRIERGMTMKELAEKADICLDTLHSWIYKGHHPDIILLCRVADALDVTLDKLVGRVTH